MTNEWLIQVVETFADEPSAREAFAALALQGGYRGGRLLEPTPEKPGWRVQCFFEDAPDAAGDGWLPDGMRRVLVLASLRERLGIGGTLRK